MASAAFLCHPAFAVVVLVVAVIVSCMGPLPSVHELMDIFQMTNKTSIMRTLTFHHFQFWSEIEWLLYFHQPRKPLSFVQERSR